MANNNNDGVENNADSSKETGLDKSFVGKFVSGLLHNTPLSKWFGKEPSKSVIRRREDDPEDDASYVFQPPVKRAKLPEHNNYSVFESPVTVHNASNNVVVNNNISSRVFGKFPEPVAGPSGIKSRQLFETHNSTASTNTVSTLSDIPKVINGENDSDSEESTSGYCSAPRLVKDKVAEDAKTENNAESCEKSTPKTRSLFAATDDGSASRSLLSERSPQLNTSLSSRRPAFNASTFGSPSFVDRTLSTKKILNSPFYNGHTIYGGASAYGRRLGRSAEDLNNSIRASVQIKPVNNEKMTNDNTTLSKTARRILSALEQYSTPISDAKKIPVTPKREGILSKYIGATPYSTREKKRPISNELQVPSIPELLQMKQKEKLQKSTVSVRQIATTSKSTLNKEEYKLRTEDDGKQKYSNKMKRNVSSLRQKAPPVDEPVSEPKLPKVSLPITTLPKFDFVMMPPQTSKNENKTVVEKKEIKKKPVENGKTVFTFSEPLVISKEKKAVSAINCFKFSEPVCKKQCLVDKAAESTTKLKNNGENVKLPKSKTTWECSMCWIRNDADKAKCVACNEPKPVAAEPKKGFGDQFKAPKDTWECGECMVRNKTTDQACVCCGSAKPGVNKSELKSVLSWKCNNCQSSNKAEANKCTSCENPKKPTFGDIFKPPSDTWECSACLIRNKKDLDKCEACQTPKSKPKVQKTVRFDDTFKLTKNTWECPTCMIRNKQDVFKCPACETLKPGEKSAPAKASPMFNFGIPSEWECKSCLVKNKTDLNKCASCGSLKESTEKKGFGDVFKIKEGEWECTSCMVRNKAGSDVCTCCGVSKSGTTAEKKSSVNLGLDKSSPVLFKFGIPPPKSEPAKENSTTSVSLVTSTTMTPVVPILSSSTATTSVGFVFGDTKPTTTSVGFTFGIGTTQEKSTKLITSTSETPSSSSSNPLLKPNEKLPEKAVLAPVGFKFGLEKSNSENVITSTSNKTEAPVIFSSSGFELPMKPTTIPTFQFKPAATTTTTTVNGDVSSNKPKDSPFSGKPLDSSNLFSSKPAAENSLFASSKPSENMNLFGSKPATDGSNLFNSKPTDSSSTLFQSKPATDNNNMFAIKPIESSNMFVNKPVESSTNLFSSSKPTESSNLFSSKSAETNLFASNVKPTESSNLFSSNKLPEGSNLFSSKPSDSSNNLFASKPPESNNLFLSKPPEGGNLFGSKPADGSNLFSSKPTEGTNLFTSNKPADSSNLFSSKPIEGSSNLFSSKPAERNAGNLFSNKPATESTTNLFASKPPETGGLFSTPPAFKFSVKPTENATSTTTSASQQEVSASSIFKFGADSTSIPMKKFGESNQNNQVSNGFGAVTKTFGAPPPQQQQLFGTTSTPENKPFSFGAAADSKNTSFSFGQPAPPPPPQQQQPQQQQPEKPQMPVFNFGAAAAPTAPAGFNFSSPPPPQSSGFNFGAAPKIENKAFGSPQSSVFGAAAATPIAAPVPAGANNGSFNFGTSSNNNNQKAIFTFGASQTNPQPSFPTQSQTPGFSFGAVAPPSVPTGGFNFTGAPPSFNFTDGTQSSTAPPQRKIKKALRRTHR